jgi:beta-glucanase (GH16 family)
MTYRFATNLLTRRRIAALATATGVAVVGAALPAAATAAHAAIPAGNPAGWTPAYSQDFTTDAATGQVGSVYGQQLLGYDGLTDTSGWGTYEPNSVLSVHDSALDIYLHSENGTPYVAAPQPDGYNAQTYGRYSVRFRADDVPGYKIAFLLWPASNNWSEGEIDYPEGNLDGGDFYGASEIKGSTNTWDLSKPFTPTNASDWHTATVEWTPGSVKWYWDDVLIGQTQNASGVPDTPMRWVLQAEATSGASTSVSGHILVDWVKAWTYTPGTPAD